MPSCFAAVQARLYDLLFKSEDPNAIKGDWLADMNPESEARHINAPG